ncbi:MAG: hypothetical protein NTV19_07425, partial [Burkholderiales bacterium]|nr:hypothetical protein [Burkholderiales bacterium]
LLGEGFDGDVRLVAGRLFYPYGWDEPHRAGESFPNALAVHRWAHSWAQPVGVVERIRRALARVRGGAR